MTRRHDESRGPADSLPEEGQQALSVLRAAWSAQGQSGHDVGEASCGHSKSCKAASAIGFEGLIDEVEPTSDTSAAVDNLSSAWRKKLEREGKLNREGTTLRDLVLGDTQSGR